jgi:hypothetical protein
MTTSICGVEHGVEVSKKREKLKFNNNEKMGAAISAVPGVGPLGGGIYGGTKAKKGKGAKVGLRAVGRGALEGGVAGTAGGALGMAATRGSMGGKIVGQTVGGLGGGAHGVASSMRNSRRKGWMKG